MTPLGNQFIRLVKEYRLDDRYPNIKKKVKMIEMGILSDSVIKILISRVQPLIEKQRRCFNPLPMAPSKEELPDYDIEVGNLVENPDVRIGIRFKERPHHIIASGATGSGKSNLLRVIIHGLDRIKKNLDTA